MFARHANVVVGKYKLTIDKVVTSQTAWTEISSGLGSLDIVTGDVHFDFTTGAVTPVIPTGTLLAVRVKVTAGSADSLAALKVGARNGAGPSVAPVVAIAAPGQKMVVWLFPGAAALSWADPMLVFPSGQTVALQ